MTPSTAVTHIGYYCGRFAPGFWGEPLNSLSNLAFVIAPYVRLVVASFFKADDPLERQI